MSPEKNSKKKSTKPSSKKTVKTPPPRNSGGGNAPFYVLVIIILITIIVLLLNKFYENGKFTIPFPKNMAARSDSVKEKSETSKERSAESKNSEDKPGKIDRLTGAADEKNQMKRRSWKTGRSLFIFLNLTRRVKKYT